MGFAAMVFPSDKLSCADETKDDRYNKFYTYHHHHILSTLTRAVGS